MDRAADLGLAGKQVQPALASDLGCGKQIDGPALLIKVMAYAVKQEAFNSADTAIW